MNENILEEIVAESYRREYEQYGNAPEHRFSIKHKFNMKRIFARYARNVNKLKQTEQKEYFEEADYGRRLSPRQKLLVAVLVIILMSLLVGWVAVFISRNFHGTVYHDYTQIFPVDTDNCPQRIECRYELSEIPDRFELVETVSSPTIVSTKYKNKSTGVTFAIVQNVKSHYDPNINTEHQKIEEIDINGNIGLCLDFSDDKHSSSLIVWDNGDYIIDIGGNLPKDVLANLAKSTKKIEN